MHRRRGNRAPVTAATAAITVGIEAALGGEALLAGFSAETVAVAVRRALTRASSWRDHDWQLVYEEPRTLRCTWRSTRSSPGRSPPGAAHAAHLGMGGTGPEHRQLPVAAQRGRY